MKILLIASPVLNVISWIIIGKIYELVFLSRTIFISCSILLMSTITGLLVISGFTLVGTGRLLSVNTTALLVSDKLCAILHWYTTIYGWSSLITLFEHVIIDLSTWISFRRLYRKTNTNRRSLIKIFTLFFLNRSHRSFILGTSPVKENNNKLWTLQISINLRGESSTRLLCFNSFVIINTYAFGRAFQKPISESRVKLRKRKEDFLRHQYPFSSPSF